MFASTTCTHVEIRSVSGSKIIILFALFFADEKCMSLKNAREASNSLGWLSWAKLWAY